MLCRIADDVAAIIRDRKVSQAALVGSSHGGNIALSVALRYPEQISDLVLVGPETDGLQPAKLRVVTLPRNLENAGFLGLPRF